MKTVKKLGQALAVSASLGIIAGCSSMVQLGEKDYACKGMPNGATCMSAKQVYSATEGDGYKTQLKQEQEKAKSEKKGDNAEGTTKVLVATGADNAPMPIKAKNPLPIRSQATVMRIAVDPWEDQNGDLNVPGYIYTEIEPRRWEIGERQPKPTPTLRPMSAK